LDADLQLDLQLLEQQIREVRPKLIVVGTSSYPRELDIGGIGKIARRNGVLVLADISHTALFQMGNVHKSIFPYIDFATFTMEKNLRGPHGGVLIYRSQYRQKVEYSTFPVTQGGPIQGVLFAKLVCFEALKHVNVQEYAERVVEIAQLFAQTLVAHDIAVIAGRPESHIILVDATSLGITGLQAEKWLEKHKILANRNLIPGDSAPPLITSGIRFGVTTLANLSYADEDVVVLACEIAKILLGRKLEGALERLVLKYHSSINTSSSETD